MEDHVDHGAPGDLVALRYHGDPAVSGQLDPSNGSMVWTTEGDPDLEPSGEFAVVDGVVVMHYDHDDRSWLRLGGRLVPWQDAGLSLEEGLSAQRARRRVRGRDDPAPRRRRPGRGVVRGPVGRGFRRVSGVPTSSVGSLLG